MDKILSILGSVGFNWHVALANFINFLIILFILNRFFFGKLGKTLDDRKKVIERGVAQASEAAKTLSVAEEKKKEIIHEAKKESRSIVEEAKTQAEALALSIKEAADKEAEAKMHMLADKEATLRESIEKDVAEALPSVIAKLYAETLRKNLTEEENNKLIASLK
jgi:F-type H+-transporting ATPase subunit b